MCTVCINLIPPQCHFLLSILSFRVPQSRFLSAPKREGVWEIGKDKRRQNIWRQIFPLSSFFFLYLFFKACNVLFFSQYWRNNTIMRSNIKTLIYLAEIQGMLSGVIQVPKIFPKHKKKHFHAKDWWGCYN